MSVCRLGCHTSAHRVLTSTQPISTSMRIAALDDEPLQLDLIKRTIASIGHECHGYEDGASLLRDLRRETFDMLVLDWQLPDISGPDLVRWVRSNLDRRMHIKFVTNRREERDIVEGLAAGADDFMVKPIRVGELAARVRALLRRVYASEADSELVFGRYRFVIGMPVLEMDGKPVDLKHREYELALFLFQNMGRLLSREHLREAVWGRGSEIPSRSLDTHISRLRNKLELRPAHGYLLTAIYGLGYRFETMAAASTSGQDAAAAPSGADPKPEVAAP